MSLFNELKRRNVIRVAAAYLVVGWLLIQVLDLAADSFSAPEWVMKMFFTFVVVGFIPAILISWAFELTPEGIKREKDIERDESITHITAKKLDYITLLAAMIVGVLIAWQQFSEPQINVENTSAQITSNIDITTKKDKAHKDNTQSSPDLGDKSIAVLPFSNRSPDKNNAYFTDGIHDDLLTQLSKVGAFKVISRTSVMEYKETSKNLKQIGQELGVATIMEGAVQRSGNQVRINVQLIDARTDEHLWAEIYDRELSTENIFEIQSEISQAIAIALKTQLTPETIASVAHAPTQNLKAYEFYLKANQLDQEITVSSVKTAIALYQSAIKLDPLFKEAWARLSMSQVTLYWYTQGDKGLLTNARSSLDNAKKIDVDFPDLYLAEGIYHYNGLLDYPVALSYLDKAIAVLPNNADAYMNKGWVSRRAGLWKQAVENMQKSLQLDPRKHLHWAELAFTLIYLHRFTEANMTLDQSKSIKPDNIWQKLNLVEIALLETGNIEQAQTHSIGLQFTDSRETVNSYITTQVLARQYENASIAITNMSNDYEIWRQLILLREDLLAQILFFKGEIDEAKIQAHMALKRLAQIREELGDDYRIYQPEARMYAVLSKFDKVRELINKAIQTSPKDALAEKVDSYQYARTFAIAGLVEETIESLEPQLKPPSMTTVTYVNLDPAFDQIRDSAEFKAMLTRHSKGKGIKQ